MQISAIKDLNTAYSQPGWSDRLLQNQNFSLNLKEHLYSLQADQKTMTKTWILYCTTQTLLRQKTHMEVRSCKCTIPDFQDVVEIYNPAYQNPEDEWSLY